MKKILALIILAQILTGCGGDSAEKPKPADKKIDLSAARDGTYTAESSRDDKLGYSTLTLTIQNHQIVAAEFTGVDLFGNVKDESYGRLTGEGDYKKAQVAVKAIAAYPKQLVETQDLRKVDAISGATISYGQFVEVTKKAVEAAAK